MSTVRAPTSILQNQNLDIHHKRSAAKGLSDGLSKPIQKKGTGGLGNRKALQDISNSSTIRQEKDTSRKKNIKKEEFNIAEEMFLHDHNRCVEARKSGMNKHIMDTLLFEHGLLYPTATSLNSKQAEVSIASSPPRYLEKEPVPELEMPEISELCYSLIQWDSPPPSPSRISLKMTWSTVMLPRGELPLRRPNSSMSAPRVDNTHTEVYPEECDSVRMLPLSSVMDLINTLFMVLMLIFQVTESPTYNEHLHLDFFKESFPLVEEIVRRNVEIAVPKEPRMAASLPPSLAFQ